MWSLKEINKALNCKISLKKNLIFNNISIDSRTVNKGNLFIPIKGKNFDGHNFIDEALKKGASASLINEKNLNSFKNKERLIPVKNTNESLSKLAIFSRKRLKNNTLICITGSSGKTTLKEWLKEILKTQFKIHANYRNYNNEIGMPLTLAKMPKETEISIIEIGMNKPGEIRNLVKIARPDIAIITNIGNAHIGNFKSKKSIAVEKSKIFDFFSKKNIAILPRDDDHFDFLKQAVIKKTTNIYSFGHSYKSDFKIFKNDNNLYNFSILNKIIKLSGSLNSKIWELNVSIILGILELLKITRKISKQSFKKLEFLEGRGKIQKIEISKKTITLIDESYNSSPNSLVTSIKNLNNVLFKLKRKICIIGDMLELGESSEKLHRDIIIEIEKSSPDILLTVGMHTKVINQNISKKIKAIHFNNSENVYNKLLKIIKNDDVVMIKGSNSTRLHEICKKLRKES
ncbi:MAG: hypothetical protein CMM99_02065 [Rickettsiales bacterium]|nr:hypothetical protein [Rickettsiales bacterium]